MYVAVWTSPGSRPIPGSGTKRGSPASGVFGPSGPVNGSSAISGAADAAGTSPATPLRSWSIVGHSNES